MSSKYETRLLIKKENNDSKIFKKDPSCLSIQESYILDEKIKNLIFRKITISIKEAKRKKGNKMIHPTSY